MNFSRYSEEEWIKNFEDAGVIKQGHFRLTSGKHSDFYVNKDSIMYDPVLFNMVVLEFGRAVRSNYLSCEVVTGPAIAGAVIAAPVALLASKHFVYPEKVDDDPTSGDPSKWTKMVFRRGYDKGIQNKKVLLIEDIITTGSSVVKTIDAIKLNDGIPVGIFCIWNRSGWTYPGLKVDSLINKRVDSWFKEECPYCKSFLEIQDPKG